MCLCAHVRRQSPTATLQSTNTHTQSSSSSSGDGSLFRRASQAAQPDETGRVPPYVDFTQFYQMWGTEHSEGTRGPGPQWGINRERGSFAEYRHVQWIVMACSYTKCQFAAFCKDFIKAKVFNSLILQVIARIRSIWCRSIVELQVSFLWVKILLLMIWHDFFFLTYRLTLLIKANQIKFPKKKTRPWWYCWS